MTFSDQSVQWPMHVKMVCEEYTKLSDQMLSFRDVLLARLHIEINDLGRVIARNNQEGIVALKNSVGRTCEDLKKLDAISSPAIFRASHSKNPG